MISDGTFAFKAHWGADVVRRRQLVSYSEVCIGKLDEAHRQRLNALGCITEHAGSFSRVWITDSDEVANDLPSDGTLVSQSGLNSFLLLKKTSTSILVPEECAATMVDTGCK